MKGFWLNLLLAIGSGILMSLAAAPLNWWGFAWIALAPFWVIVSRSEGRRSLLYTLAWGFSYHGLTLSWILGLHPLTWMGVPWLASMAIALFCWIFITLWGTVANLVWAWAMGKLRDRRQESEGQSARFTNRRRQKAGGLPSNFSESAPSHLLKGFVWRGEGIGFSLLKILVGTALWCGLEFVLNLTPLSWTSLAFTQSPGNLVILHLGRLSGPLLITATIVAFNGLLAEAWMQVRSAPPGTQPALPLVAIASFLVITAHGMGFYFYHQPLADAASDAVKIGVIQGNIPTREKLSSNGIQRAIEHYVGGYESLTAEGVDAVLTPEGSLPFLWDKSRNPLRAAVLEKGVAAWLGIFVANDGNISQSLLSLTSKGEVVGRYNKIKLVPLGEYIPFQNTLGQFIGRLSPIKSSMVPGTINQIFETPFGRAIASICYESVFPELFRKQAAAGGQFILTASNLDPYNEVLMTQHQAHDLMRAIETDRWAARATNTGYSGFIDPHGTIVWRSQPQMYQIYATTIYRRQTQTGYVRWGDWATPSLLGISLMLLIYRRTKNLHP